MIPVQLCFIDEKNMSDIEVELEVLKKAELLYDSGRYQLALDALKGINNESVFSSFSGFHSIYVGSCLEIGRSREALDFILSKLTVNPNKASLHSLLSSVYTSLNKPQESMTHILKAIEVDPENDHYHTKAAALFFQKGDSRKADHHLKISEELDPESMEIIYLRALMHIHTDNHKDAEIAVRRGLSLYPDSSLFQNLFTHLKSKHRPSVSKLKELSLTALEGNPFDTSAKDSLLFSLKNSNPFVRFFVANGFNRYKIKWTFRRIIITILFWKASLLWGGFGLLYLLITWAGTALFYTIIRKHPKYKYVIPQKGVQMSNVFLVISTISILGITLMYQYDASLDALVGAITCSLFLLLTSISYFEIKSKSGKIGFVVYLLISAFLLFMSIEILLLFSFLCLFLLLVYAFLFTLNITFK